MKTNTMMRVASVLLVAVLLSTCAISGTFAKYVTSDSGSDTARVAKWGVTITVAEDFNLFESKYAKHDTNISDTSIENTVAVNSDGADNLVAPGTDHSMTFSITGTPEVAVKVDLAMVVNNDVKIPQGTVVNGAALTQDYTPVVFTLKEKDATDVIATGTLTEIKSALEALSDEYAPNTDLNKTYELSWEWAFSSDNNVNDANDTFLGNAAVTPVDGVVTDINFEIEITVTQLD